MRSHVEETRLVGGLICRSRRAGRRAKPGPACSRVGRVGAAAGCARAGQILTMPRVRSQIGAGSLCPPPAPHPPTTASDHATRHKKCEQETFYKPAQFRYTVRQEPGAQSRGPQARPGHLPPHRHRRRQAGLTLKRPDRANWNSGLLAIFVIRSSVRHAALPGLVLCRVRPARTSAQRETWPFPAASAGLVPSRPGPRLGARASFRSPA